MSHTYASLSKHIVDGETKLGELRKIAKEIKKDHDLALELWSSERFLFRQLAILIADKKQIDQDFINSWDADIQNHPEHEQTELIDWLLANQLSKDKKLVALLESWQHSHSPLQRRLFWYHQARLRWMGKTDFNNTEQLLVDIEKDILQEAPIVQWAMNYTTGQIGKFQEQYRDRCKAIGERTGLYKDEVVPRGCTPSYLPLFIDIEVAKLQK